jgi:FixJ family two-component response regulator
MISIVDDDPVVRDATADLINSLGYATLAFESAEQFLQSGHVEDTSCLVTDLQMPGMNGLDLQSLLLKKGYNIPIIFITAFPKEQARAAALKAGAVAFLTKPFEEGSLLNSLKIALHDVSIT